MFSNVTAFFRLMKIRKTGCRGSASAWGLRPPLYLTWVKTAVYEQIGLIGKNGIKNNKGRTTNLNRN
nr:MAG: hypothetical protein EDM05_21855 [Leptolyngbya sp. IPPAS B-1204]